VAQPPSAGATSAATIQWELSFLQSNWRKVIDALSASRQFGLVGLLQPAKVSSLEGKVLTLAFEPEHETLRAKCAGDMKRAIEAALSAMAGQAVQIDCVVTLRAPAAVNPDQQAAPGTAAAAPARPRPAFGELSTAEKSEIMKDSAVRAVLDLFGGEVVDIRRNEAAPATPSVASEGEDDGRADQG